MFFQAYVGGLYLDQGLEVIKPWLYTLLRPYAAEAYRIVRGQHGLPVTPIIPLPNAEQPNPNNTDLKAPSQHTIGHLALFNQHAQQRHLNIEWRFDKMTGEGTSSTPIWVASAYLDSELLGRGQGGTKKAAQNEAAKLGLRELGVRY